MAAMFECMSVVDFFLISTCSHQFHLSTMSRTYRTTDISRERNRVHAQRTRLRKKEHMQTLQSKADELKAEQLKLRQIINEKNTATILVRLFAEGSSPDSACQDEDPLVESVLRRSQEDIPDASTIPELPALILPGQHASKKIRANMQNTTDSFSCELSLDGIDYELLGRDRSQCTPEELDLIRRERNRMHAKRTRDRKRIFTEKLAEICRQLEDENTLLHMHLKKIDPDYQYEPPSRKSTPTSSNQSSPTMQPMRRDHGSVSSLSLISQSSDGSQNNRRKMINDGQMIHSLLKAAEREFHEISDTSGKDHDEQHLTSKRQRVNLSY
jgi:Basic region leucine zipper/bZIP transcription factor